MRAPDNCFLCRAELFGGLFTSDRYSVRNIYNSVRTNTITPSGSEAITPRPQNCGAPQANSRLAHSLGIGRCLLWRHHIVLDKSKESLASRNDAPTQQSKAKRVYAMNTEFQCVLDTPRVAPRGFAGLPMLIYITE